MVCLLSAGLVYIGYLVHVWQVACRAPCVPAPVLAGMGECVLVFGKRAPGGRIDADFNACLDRAAALWHVCLPQRMVLLGGGSDGEPTEADLAHAGLLAHGIAVDVPLLLENGKPA